MRLMLSGRRAGSRGALRGRVRESFLVRQAGANLVVNVLILGLGLGTGSILARALGPAGRGQMAAVMVPPVIIAVLVEMGCSQAITYEHARDPSARTWLTMTWLTMLLPSVVVGIAVGELVLRVTLRNQVSSVQQLGSAYMTVVVLLVTYDVGIAVLLGDHRFLYFNVQRLALPSGILVLLAALWSAGHLQVASALVTTYAATATASVVTIGVAIRRYGAGRFDWARGRTSLWYGIRALGTNVSLVVNGRLDQLILPAFVTASALGLYAIAVSVAGIAFYVAAPLAILVLPAAARRRRDQPEIVRRATQGAFVIAAGVGAVLALVAEPAVVHVYGRPFVGSVVAVWIMIPGYAVFVAGYTLWQGLYAAGRPLSAAMAQLAGLIVTVAGLLWFLPRGGGIVAAAAVSSIAYATVMLASLFLFCRAVGMHPARFLSVRSFREPIGVAAEEHDLVGEAVAEVPQPGKR